MDVGGGRGLSWFLGCWRERGVVQAPEGLPCTCVVTKHFEIGWSLTSPPPHNLDKDHTTVSTQLH